MRACARLGSAASVLALSAAAAPLEARCGAAYGARKDCGFSGVTKAQCEDKGCCYRETPSPNPDHYPYCFDPSGTDADDYPLAGKTFRLKNKGCTAKVPSCSIREDKWVSFTDAGSWLYTKYDSESDAMTTAFVAFDTSMSTHAEPNYYVLQNVYPGTGVAQPGVNKWLGFASNGKWLRTTYSLPDAMPILFEKDSSTGYYRMRNKMWGYDTYDLYVSYTSADLAVRATYSREDAMLVELVQVGGPTPAPNRPTLAPAVPDCSADGPDVTSRMYDMRYTGEGTPTPLGGFIQDRKYCNAADGKSSYGVRTVEEEVVIQTTSGWTLSGSTKLSAKTSVEVSAGTDIPGLATVSATTSTEYAAEATMGGSRARTAVQTKTKKLKMTFPSKDLDPHTSTSYTFVRKAYEYDGIKFTGKLEYSGPTCTTTAVGISGTYGAKVELDDTSESWGPIVSGVKTCDQVPLVTLVRSSGRAANPCDGHACDAGHGVCVPLPPAQPNGAGVGTDDAPSDDDAPSPKGYVCECAAGYECEHPHCAIEHVCAPTSAGSPTTAPPTTSPPTTSPPTTGPPSTGPPPTSDGRDGHHRHHRDGRGRHRDGDDGDDGDDGHDRRRHPRRRRRHGDE